MIKFDPEIAEMAYNNAIAKRIWEKTIEDAKQIYRHRFRRSSTFVQRAKEVLSLEQRAIENGLVCPKVFGEMLNHYCQRYEIRKGDVVAHITKSS